MGPAGEVPETADSACPTADELKALSSGQIDNERAAAITAHLRSCPTCRSDRERMAQWSQSTAETVIRIGTRTGDLLDIPLDTTKFAPGSGSQDGSDFSDKSDYLPARYQVRRHLGRGGFGQVYEAVDTELRRLVAVKVLRQERLDSGNVALFREEARKLAKIRHKAVVQVYDIGCIAGRWYIVTELVAGGALLQKLQAGPLPVSEAVRLIAEVAEGLHFVHRQGIIHRDIKPANILLDEDGQPRLTDFGIAASEEDQLDEGPGTLGTTAYMSPEQIRGDAHLMDVRSDIYSLGNVLYQCLAGRLPFLGGSHDQYLDQILHRPPRSLRTLRDEVPAELDRICLKCLEKDPADRYATAADLAGDLRRVSGKSRRRPLWIGAGIAAVLLVGLLLRGFLPGAASAEPQAQNPVPPAGQAPAVAPANVLTVTFDSKPSAHLVVYPLDPEYRVPVLSRRKALGRTPLTTDLEPGDYLVVAWKEDGRFHEVYRRVPRKPDQMPLAQWAHKRWIAREKGRIELPLIQIPDVNVASGMARFPGAPEFEAGLRGGHFKDDSTIPPHSRRVPAFVLDPREVTITEFKAANGGALPLGPATVMNSELPEDSPVIGVWFDDAVQYAERVGKRLPTEFEYEFAATSGGRTRYPWGDDAGDRKWTYEAAGRPPEDRTPTNPPVFGLFSNVAEWTDTQFSGYPPHLRKPLPQLEPIASDTTGSNIVRGGDYKVAQRTPDAESLSRYSPRGRLGLDRMTALPGLGFRCARSPRPRLAEADFEAALP